MFYLEFVKRIHFLQATIFMKKFKVNFSFIYRTQIFNNRETC